MLPSSIVTVERSGALTLFTGATFRLIDAATASKARGTRETYAKHFKAFAEFLGREDPEDAVQALIRLAPGQANAVVESFKVHTRDAGLGSSTINGRISALRSVVKTARKFGLCTLALDVDLVPSEPYRDTAGPGGALVGEVIRGLHDSSGAKSVRDRALISLVYDLALRRSEAVGLDLADLELEGERPTVAILGKGRSEKERRTLPRETVQSLREWIQIRGTEPGPLFTSLDHARKGTGRLSGSGLWSLCKKLGLGRPHGLRHASITSALEITGGNLRDVQKHSRHRDLATVCLYDDRREDTGGKVAQLVATARQ
jgi:integrase/recombinase XerC